MEQNLRKSIMSDMSNFSPMFSNLDDYIEVTEWFNGEGYDISFKDKHISLHIDELNAINYLTNKIQYDFKEK